MSIEISKPSKLLSPFIKQYWAINNKLSPNEKHIQRIVPGGLIEMTFYFNDIPKSQSKDFELNNFSVLSGQLNNHYDLEIKGHLNMFSVTFEPLGALMFFDIPLNEVVNQNVCLNFILKNQAYELENKLYDAKNFNERITIIESYLYRLLCKKNKVYEFDRINNSLTKLNAKKGNITVDELANLSFYSRKQFERKFAGFIGISPKQFLRIVKFQSAIYNKQMYPNISLTNLTYLSGYYDQSHMANTFKTLTGLSPKQYFSECEPVSDYFSI